MKRKKTGEAALFAEIWEERPRYCQDCGKWLGNQMRTFFFSHNKSKGAHPELRLQEDNITLRCFKCHDLFDNGSTNTKPNQHE